MLRQVRLPIALRSLASLVAGGILLTGAGLSPARAASVNLTLVAYSTPAPAYARIIPAFQKTKAGAGVTFTQSYGASSSQAAAVANGLHADVVNLSLEPDVATLVQRHLVASNWYKNKYHGFVTDSTVVFVVRKGNPKHIHTWNDILKNGIGVITPNPFTSGSARWNIMAAYGAQIAQHKTKAQGVAYLRKLFNHVKVQNDSASLAMQTFLTGEGNVLLSYEDEAVQAQQKGSPISYVVPPQSILIENPVAVTKEAASPKTANAFVSYLYSRPAQEIFAQMGYWSVIPRVAREFTYPHPKTQFTIRQLGAWPKVQKQFFDPRTGIMAAIERKSGVQP
ncbi:MAG TPA: sulfate ABC transporter substrate-binding protein [Chloroflexota bacterium]|nr:sulfate ABC transporter substrate-binding protein [Chloroflexota bacterium]